MVEKYQENYHRKITPREQRNSRVVILHGFAVIVEVVVAILDAGESVCRSGI